MNLEGIGIILLSHKRNDYFLTVPKIKVARKSHIKKDEEAVKTFKKTLEINATNKD